MMLLDLSLPLAKQLLHWPGDPPARFQTVKTVRQHGVGLSRFSLGSHAGTHVDAPKHFLLSGRSVDRLPLDSLLGPARVVAIPRSVRLIEVHHLSRLPIAPGERLLLKTDNTRRRLLFQRRFPSGYTSLSLPAARWLVARRIALVGTDFLSIEERGAAGHPVHRTLLKAGVVIVEGLDLTRVRAGRYHLTVLPLRVVGADGAPARAVLQMA